MSLGGSGNATIRGPQDGYNGAESTLRRYLKPVPT